MKSRIAGGRVPSGSGRRVGHPRPSGTVLKVGSDFYVLASSLGSRRSTSVLTDGRSFSIFDAGGDIVESPLEALGFFHRDTRYLSRFELRIAGQTPYYLNSFLSDDKAQLRVNLTNPDLGKNGDIIEFPRNSIQVERAWALAQATLVHRLVVRNFARSAITLALDFTFGVDFADLFEVRGVKRKRHGQTLKPALHRDRVEFYYRGLDRATRRTAIRFDPPPLHLDAHHAAFKLALEPDAAATLEVCVTGGADSDPAHGSPPPVALGATGHHPVAAARPAPARGRAARTNPGADGVTNFAGALSVRHAEISALQRGATQLSASNEILDNLLRRSQCDLTSIIARGADGTFIMAGIPWFATLFGRDSILTALSILPFNPSVAAGTLRTLARFQGTEVNPDRDEQPGKIIHEMRSGEMAVTGEIPFGRYYGSVDSTPLFLWLYGRYVAATGDLKLANELWPNVERALAWIDNYGDVDHDGYVEYIRETPRGLSNQGWKDSFDSISHADGTLARAPIALAEVQGYVYAAYIAIADVASRLNRNAVATRLADRAQALRTNFTRDFWLEPESTVALALDADKRPCRVMTSNAAHAMACGLLDRDREAALAPRLLAADMFSGWGVRTLSANEKRYNPMSYHNGSIWPHDNAIAAMALARIPGRAGALRILEGLFDAAVHLDSGSLPELFCGFPREPRLGPVPYPVACHPQAWAAASVFLILQAILGLEVHGFDRRLVIDSPVLPDKLEWLMVDGLAVGNGAASFLVRGTPRGASVEISDKRGPITIEVKT